MRRSVTAALGAAALVAGCGHFGQPQAMPPATGSGKAVPVTTSSVAPADSAAAKKTFCAVFAQEVQKTDGTTDRFIASSAGDEQHPKTNWDDPDHWFADMAAGASIIFDYAAETLEAQITASLPADVSEKAKALVASMRKLSDLFEKQSAVVDLKAESTRTYGPVADEVDKLCKSS